MNLKNIPRLLILGLCFALALSDTPSFADSTSQKKLCITHVVPEQRKIVEEAIRGWNFSLKLNYLVVSDDASALPIFSTETPFSGENSQAVGLFVGDAIFIRPCLNGTNLRRTIYHELGHMMGLDHIDDSLSIMNPYVDKMRIDTPSPSDSKRARQLVLVLNEIRSSLEGFN